MESAINNRIVLEKMIFCFSNLDQKKCSNSQLFDFYKIFKGERIVVLKIKDQHDSSYIHRRSGKGLLSPDVQHGHTNQGKVSVDSSLIDISVSPPQKVAFVDGTIEYSHKQMIYTSGPYIWPYVGGNTFGWAVDKATRNTFLYLFNHWHTNFFLNASGVVEDKRTGLEWVAGPDTDTSWHGAKHWVEKLQLDGGGWRLPTIEELKELYQKDVGPRNITTSLKTSGWRVWSSDTDREYIKFVFRFDIGSSAKSFIKQTSMHRAFAVRAKKK